MSVFSSPSEYGYTHTPRQTPSITEVNQMKQTLRSRRVNTLTELRRIERILASLPNFASEHIHDLTESFGFYVSSNNLLQELRGISRQYPFSTELLEDAKARVYHDPNSIRSWNLAWLLLVKIKADQMIPDYAHRTSRQPAMWGGVVPDPRHAAELASVLIQEWTRAVDQLLRHWPTPPTLDGSW
ncbi:hypothetical protein FN846DRAFT_935276 [Sphaerosporella brunnea]|uniref:Uncharacterized protein n=1 Tax=Sphaerosporella brunnea TaxID=1250544 RepID=A0A5J5F519_9PEZI|nr:hypothetical protein FN846DRAFT_935276 [Sphaerosporella brunnea]